MIWTGFRMRRSAGVTLAGELYTQEDARNDRIQVYSHTGFQYVKLYAPPFCWARRPSPAISPANKS